jgi:hypothetical protein
MNICTIALLCTMNISNVLTVNVPAPEYHLLKGKLTCTNCVYINPIGAPNVPSRKVTIAIPPGAVVESVSFSSSRREVGECLIEPTRPMEPLSDHGAVRDLRKLFEEKRREFYAQSVTYPLEYGRMVSKGGLRKYSLVDVLCYHFSFNPVEQKLYYSENISIEVRYRLVKPGGERGRFWERLKDDVTFDDIAKECIYNWEDAERWYRTDEPQRADGYYIIVPSSLVGSVDTLVSYHTMQGYSVQVVTKEYIESNVQGVDFPQKLRNYLRENMADILFALLVGFSTDMEWRSVVPFNNDPDSPYNNPDISPIPTDLYYAELTDHDSLSWNSDRDSYYGEVYDQFGQLLGEDSPDYHADIHLGRIPIDNYSAIEDICQKLISFDMNTNTGYKTSALLAGAVYYYANEDYGGGPRNDGADYLEELMNDSIVERANSVTLYEKGGLDPCTLTCTDSLTRNNMILYWQDRGIMYETHHGNETGYARKVWEWDDGDMVPEANEISWPFSLYTSDVTSLDNDNPATCFLRSCLCGNPDVNGFSANLLYRGASAIISSSRICWMTYSDPGGIPYHFYKRLLRDTTESHGMIGPAYDIARNDFMDNTSFWLSTYHYNLFGDPALCQFGRSVAVAELPYNTTRNDFGLYPNPFSELITLQFSTPLLGEIELNVYDGSGRFVKQLFKGYMREEKKQLHVKLPTGIYFVTLSKGELKETKKVIVIK